MARQSNDHIRALRELEDNTNSLMDTKTQIQKSIEMSTRKIRNCEDMVSMLRGEVDAQTADAETEAVQLQERIAMARTELHTAQAMARDVSPGALHGLEVSLSTQVAALESQRRRLGELLTHAMLACARHKDTIQEKLSTLCAKVSAKGEVLASGNAQQQKHQVSSNSNNSSANNAAIRPSATSVAFNGSLSQMGMNNNNNNRGGMNVPSAPVGRTSVFAASANIAPSLPTFMGRSSIGSTFENSVLDTTNTHNTSMQHQVMPLGRSSMDGNAQINYANAGFGQKMVGFHTNNNNMMMNASSFVNNGQMGGF